MLQGMCKEHVGGDCALLSGIFALCTCFGPVVPLFGELSFPKERDLVLTGCPSSARQLARFRLLCLA